MPRYEGDINRLLTEQEPLLDMALNAVIEALRMNPDRYNVIYNSKYEGNETVFDSSRGYYRVILFFSFSFPLTSKPRLLLQ